MEILAHFKNLIREQHDDSVESVDNSTCTEQDADISTDAGVEQAVNSPSSGHQEPAEKQPAALVQEFLQSSETELELNGLSSSSRHQVHKLATHFGLDHTSHREESERVVSLKKPALVEARTEPEPVELVTVEEEEEVTSSCKQNCVLGL